MNETVTTPCTDCKAPPAFRKAAGALNSAAKGAN